MLLSNNFLICFMKFSFCPMLKILKQTLKFGDINIIWGDSLTLVAQDLTTALFPARNFFQLFGPFFV